MNVILTNISKLKEGANSSNYHSEYEKDYGMVSGLRTSDAPVKVLMLSMLKEKCTEPIKIVALATKESESVFDGFKQEMQAFADEKGLTLEETKCVVIQEKSKSIDINSEAELEYAKAIQEIVQVIPPQSSVYLDTTGGFRNIAYLVIAVLRILEFSKITVKKAVYSKFENHTVMNFTQTYRLLDLINAANSFTAFGNSTELKQFFGERQNPQIASVIQAMNDFSEAVALCRTKKLDDKLKKLNESLTDLETMVPSQEDEVLFSSLSRLIRRKFHMGEQNEIGYPEIIQWCLDNQMIQQAVTIYTERIPEYLLKENFYQVSDTLKQEIDSKKGYNDRYYAIFYSDQHSFMSFTPPSVQAPIAAYLKRYTDNEAFIKDMSESTKVQELIRKNQAYRDGIDLVTESGLISNFTLLNTLFDRRGRRVSDFNDPIYSNKHKNLLPIAQKHNAKSKEKFICVLMSQLSHEEYCLLQGGNEQQKTRYKDGHLNAIEYLDEMVKEQSDYSILVSTSDMQKIMREYYYIKSFLRNAINHANDEAARSDETIEYFNRHGYSTDDNISLDKVKEILGNALVHIKKCKKEHTD